MVMFPFFLDGLADENGSINWVEAPAVTMIIDFLL